MKKTISITLSLILLFSSIGMARSTHFCGGLEMLSELSFKASHIDCGMEQKAPDCDSAEHDHDLKQKACCDNQYELLQLDEDFSIVKAGLNLDLDFAVSFVHTFIFNALLLEPNSTGETVYYPPVLKQDHQILFQTFLI